VEHVAVWQLIPGLWSSGAESFWTKCHPRLWNIEKPITWRSLLSVNSILSHGNQTCLRISMCNLAPWSNCCSVPKLESLQKRALRIIHPIAYDMPCDSACAYAAVEPLSIQRYNLGKIFFCTVTNADTYLHDLLLQRRDSDTISWLRRLTIYPIPQTRTNKYRSFVHFALAKYQ